MFDLLIRGGTLVVPGLEPFADVAADFAAPLDLRDGTTAAAGDLADCTGREVVDAEGLFVHAELDALDCDDGGRLSLREGLPASFTLRRGADAESEPVAVIRDGGVQETEAAGAR